MADLPENKFFLFLAVVAVVVSLVAAGFTYMSIANLATKLSGYATSTGQANLTVESAAIVNFTTNYISWGSGRVNTGQSFAYLNTLETSNVTNGNWSLATGGGFRLENIVNTNVSIDLLAGKSAATFIGGKSPGYQWNVSVVEVGSCLNSSFNGTGNLGLDVFATVNNTSPGTRFCERMPFTDSNDSIRIDINLTVPYNSNTGALTDTITATATTV